MTIPARPVPDAVGIHSRGDCRRAGVWLVRVDGGPNDIDAVEDIQDKSQSESATGVSPPHHAVNFLGEASGLRRVGPRSEIFRAFFPAARPVSTLHINPSARPADDTVAPARLDPERPVRTPR